MSNIQRFRHADPKRVIPYAVDSAQVIEIGDMVYQEVDDVRAASQITYGTLALAQARLARKFAGIAMTASASGETTPVSVAKQGVFEMDCAAAQFEIGDRVNADDNATPDALLDQQVIAVGENGIGLMRVAKRYSANTTRVICEIIPRDLYPDQLIPITLFSGLVTSAVDFVTDWAVPFPFKLVYVDAIVQVLTAGILTATIDNGATGLDDTITVGDASAVGTVVRTTMDDATGDDIFEANDTLTIKGDGTPTAGEVMFVLWVYPFLNES
jgi:hypothetical protein